MLIFFISGTSRPAHYVVIADDNDFKADELHKLTYHLCHVYARCTKSISVPVPVQYAHLAAYRARQYYLSKRGDDNSSSSQHSGSLSLAEVEADIRVLDALKNSMYFVWIFFLIVKYSNSYSILDKIIARTRQVTKTSYCIIYSNNFLIIYLKGTFIKLNIFWTLCSG